jgi:Mrp family chromosome partitioning ATPase
MVIGLAGGMMVGLLLVFLFEASDKKITTHEDIKKYLNVKTLGIIPLNSIDDKIRSKKGKEYVKPAEGNTLNIKILSDPNSLVSESVRMIRTNLDFADLKLINVTSTMPSEGKSEFITNLASSFALLDKKVLVVDCDLRKPKVHRNFGLQRGKGLSNILLSKGDVYYKNVIQGFVSNKVRIDVLTAGAQVSNPSELINSKAFEELLKELKEE